MGRSSGGGGRGGGTSRLQNLVSEAVREIRVPDTTGMTARAASVANSQARGGAIVRAVNRVSDAESITLARRINTESGSEWRNALLRNYETASPRQRSDMVSSARDTVLRYLESNVPRF